MFEILHERESHISVTNDAQQKEFACDKVSVAGSVSQRACVFCGSRVVLYPITDALHVVHGPIGCAAYTWDIRGALSSDRELHRMSFSTDLREIDIIHGGEKKLYTSLLQLIAHHAPKAAFVYATCITGIIGDDVDAICRKVEKETGIPVLPVHSEGFKGTKKDGYRAACDALFALIKTAPQPQKRKNSINIIGDFNIAGETWLVKEYYRRMGVEVIATMTGDGRVDDIRNAHAATLNVVQCSGSMVFLAEMMEKEYGIPFIRVSYFGIDDAADALYQVADFLGDETIKKRTEDIVRGELTDLLPAIEKYREKLKGKKAALYVGGAFKARSLIKALRLLDMNVVMAGTQTGNKKDYEELRALCDSGTTIVDDAGALELAKFMIERDVDVFIGGVKERPIAYKLGIGFCDHNHERKEGLAGFEGMLKFVQEIYASVMSPVWNLVPRRAGKTIGNKSNESLGSMREKISCHADEGGEHDNPKRNNE